MLKEKGIIAHYILASVVNNFFAHFTQNNIKHCTQTNDQQDTQTPHGDSTSQQWASFGFSSPTLLDTLQLAPPFVAPALRAQKSYWLHPTPRHIIG
jgi:hypothetical protein